MRRLQTTTTPSVPPRRVQRVEVAQHAKRGGQGETRRPVGLEAGVSLESKVKVAILVGFAGLAAFIFIICTIS